MNQKGQCFAIVQLHAFVGWQIGADRIVNAEQRAETSKGCSVLRFLALPFDVSAMRKTYEQDASSSRHDAAIVCDSQGTKIPIADEPGQEELAKIHHPPALDAAASQYQK